jgi:predicted transcriptional regulator
MSTAITLDLPDAIYQRLASAAKATQRPLAEVLLRALRMGSPPCWDDVPEEKHAELAVLDRLDDDALYTVARERWSQADADRYDGLLGALEAGSLTDEQREELSRLRDAHDRLALRKGHAAALLRWRGRLVPAP